MEGFYSMYCAHNLDFLAIANSMQGRYRDAIDASNELVDFSRQKTNAVAARCSV